MTEQKHKLYSTALCISGRAALAPINGREVSVIGYRTADLGSVYTVTHESKSPRSFEYFEFELRPVVSPINRECADSRHALVANVLAVAAERLNVILNPWGFYFTNDGVRSSHCGPFASGYYCRKTTRIEISCRDTIDNLYYQHTFLVPHAYCTESERYTIDHSWLMEALGHNNDRYRTNHAIMDNHAATA